MLISQFFHCFHSLEDFSGTLRQQDFHSGGINAFQSTREDKKKDGKFLGLFPTLMF
jgi:hypothetical protein